jgi:hypothetical protein
MEYKRYGIYVPDEFSKLISDNINMYVKIRSHANFIFYNDFKYLKNNDIY